MFNFDRIHLKVLSWFLPKINGATTYHDNVMGDELLYIISAEFDDKIIDDIRRDAVPSWARKMYRVANNAAGVHIKIK